MKKLFILLFLALFACDADDDSPVIDTSESAECEQLVMKGNRVMGIDLLDVGQSGDFDENIALANELGIDFIALHLPWSSIETTPGEYEDPGSAIQLLAEVAEANGWKFSLTIRPIDLTGKTVPTDLENSRFNEAIMEQRFKSLIDFILTRVNVNTLHNFMIGNEIDGYNTANEPVSFWSDYGVFLKSMTTYLHAQRSDLKVGFTGTFYGLLREQSTFEPLFENVDIIGVNYYPLNGDFTVKGSQVVFDEMDQFMSIYSETPVYIQELGYQTAEASNSNQNQQAEFIDNFFCVWDSYSDQIKSVSLVRLNDLSTTAAQNSAVPYGLTDPLFIDYLRTLGLRNYDGTLKAGFDELNENLEERGW